MPEIHRPTEPATAVTYGHSIDMDAILADQPVRRNQLPVRVWKAAEHDCHAPASTANWIEASARALEEAGIRPGTLIVLDRDLAAARTGHHEPRYCRVRELLGTRGTNRLVHVNWLYASFGTVHRDEAPEALEPER